MSGLLSEKRRLMIQCARSSRMRVNAFSTNMPTDWGPTSIVNPETGFPFSDDTAWNLIADLLEDEHEIEEVTLNKPPGCIAYVMKYKLDSDAKIYIKIHMGPSNKIIGRSFHRSYK